MNPRLKQITARLTVWLTCFSALAPSFSQETAAAPQLNIIVTDGQGAINNIRQGVGRGMTVRVEDEKQQPVAGVPVTFTLPAQGAGGSFNGEKTLIVNTDAQGLAVARGLKPNSVAGKFEIRVTASHAGRRASATITQFNMDVRNPGSGGGGKWVAIILAAGGAGAAGAIFGLRGSSRSSTPAAPPAPAVISITPASGSVGPPQ